MRTISDQELRAGDLMGRIDAVQARANAESRDTTPDEGRDIDTMLAEYDNVQADIGRRRRIENASSHLAAPAPPNGNASASGNGRSSNGTPPSGPSHWQRPDAALPYRVTVENRASATHGFRDIGEFAYAVKNASLGSGRIDPRLFNSAGPPDNVMTESINTDGGYAVPPDFRPDIKSLIEAPTSLMGMTDGLTTSSNAITVPIDASTPWQTTGGIQAYWEAEAAQKKNSKLGLDQVTCKLNKLYVLVPVSDELLEDAPALGTLLRTKAPQAIDFKVTDAIINGTGTGQPLGILNSPATIIVPRPATQPLKTVNADNVLDMWAALLSSSRTRAVWLTSQEIEANFPRMFIPIVDETGKLVNGEVAYLPPGGLSGQPYGTLMGRPVIVTEAAPDPGTTGDLLLVDLKSYMSATKVDGIQQAISIHLWFDWDITCFRFVLRYGSCPWFKAPVTSKSGAYHYSPFVALGGDGVTGTEIAGKRAPLAQREAGALPPASARLDTPSGTPAQHPARSSNK